MPEDDLRQQLIAAIRPVLADPEQWWPGAVADVVLPVVRAHREDNTAALLAEVARLRAALGQDVIELVARVSALEDELGRLHTWEGLMELLGEHYPPDVFNGSSGDPGPRIMTLIRAVDEARRGAGGG